jgi:hypothetical protein
VRILATMHDYVPRHAAFPHQQKASRQPGALSAKILG